MAQHTELESRVEERLNLLVAWIEAQMAYRGQPGLSAAIVQDQELVWARGFGFADVDSGRQATADTRYRIASITKTFTSTALLQLRDAGRLQLDDPVQKHLPWAQFEPAEAGVPPVTLRHLITHTSGLPREAPFPYWTDSHFPPLADLQAALPAQQGIYAPETRLKYSNLALALAGEVVSAVSEMPYPAYIRQHILEPLGMTDTLVETPFADDPQLATGYGRRLPDGSRTRSPQTDAQGLTPAFNMSSTAHDLARFVMLQFRTDAGRALEIRAQILHSRTLREMQRVHWLDSDWKRGWGLGFSIMRMGERTLVGHGGAVLGHRTLIQFWPAERIGVIVLTNADDGAPDLYLEKVFNWVAPALVTLKREQEREQAQPPDERYLGRFRNPWRDVEIIVLDGGLVMIDPSLSDPLATKAILEPLEEHTFRMQTDNPTAAPGELARFELDGEGKVVRLKLGENYYEPVGAW